MIVAIQRQDSARLEQVRAALLDWGVQEIRSCRIGLNEVLIAPGASHEVADRARSLPGVARVVFPLCGSPLAERRNFAADTVVEVKSAVIGGRQFAVLAGPCAVESREQLKDSAVAVSAGGAAVLRGGAFKPRTSPHSFQGTQWEGIRLLADVGRTVDLPVVSEVVDPRDVQQMAEHVDMLQIGTRNAQNYALLAEAGRAGVPVLLKRGFGCNVDEWLGAAEYILQQGNGAVVMCERGIRTFEAATRFTLDLAAIPVIKQRSHLPVVVDPSHSTGSRDLVIPMALAAAAAGADGLLVDVHTQASSAKCDAEQALSAEDFHGLMDRLRLIMPGIGRSLSRPRPGRSWADQAALRGLSSNGTARGDSGLRTAGLPSVVVRNSKECR